MRNVTVAVVGCGAISEAYLRNLKDRFSIINLVACSDLVEERMLEKAERFGIRAMSFDEILQDESIEMVINLTNPAVHYVLTKQALLAGKHVYSEKMLAVTVEQAEELCRIAEEKGLYLGVAPDTFLGASIQTARYLIDHGMIGKPLSYVVSLTRDFEIYGEILPHLRKPGGDLAMDTGCYYLVALASLLGPAREVAAFCDTHEPERKNHRVTDPGFGEPYTIEVENRLAATIRYESGVLGTFHINSDSIFNENRIMRIFGTEGILNIEDPNRFGAKITMEKAFGEPVEFPLTHGFADEGRGIGAAEMAWAIRGGRKNRASKEMGLHVMEMIAGMIKSSDTGTVYRLHSTFLQPDPLPAGYVGGPQYGMWAPTEETALV